MLRGIAVLMVIIHHDWIENAYFLRSGVDLFFVLSGFLISGLLFSEFQKSGEIRVGRFLVRRAFKIYPAFYFLFFFSTIGFFVLSHGHLPATNKVIGEATFTQNYVDSLWGYTWSLAVEEHFYLFLPLLLLAMSRIWPQTRFRSLPVISLIFSIVCLSLRLATHPHGVFEWQGLYITEGSGISSSRRGRAACHDRAEYSVGDRFARIYRFRLHSSVVPQSRTFAKCDCANDRTHWHLFVFNLFVAGPGEGFCLLSATRNLPHKKRIDPLRGRYTTLSSSGDCRCEARRTSSAQNSRSVLLSRVCARSGRLPAR